MEIVGSSAIVLGMVSVLVLGWILAMRERRGRTMQWLPYLIAIQSLVVVGLFTFMRSRGML